MTKVFRKLVLGTLLIAMCLGQVFAQDRVVSGKVIDDKGTPLPGVNILVKGTTNGTTSDANGGYSISVSGTNAVLIYSFIGFKNQELEVGSRTSIDVTMAEDVATLAEVVVTSFGLEKEKKALGFSVTQINGDKFTESRAVNLGNALTGKIAGVNVTPPASGAAGSTRVIIRGGSSLTGNNQPLYVVNGMPISSGNLGNAGMWGGNDSGDGLAAINPDDIESISVLKGNAASALYGARAANGVVLITTKSGKARKGLGIVYTSNVTFDKAQDFTDYQKEYGTGRDGAVPANAADALDIGLAAWGKKYDNSNVIQFDGVSRPYTHLGQGINDFYRTGTTVNNSIAITGGNESTTYRVGFSNLSNKDIMPNAGFSRKVANVNINSKLKKLTLDLSTQYSNQKADNRPRLSDTPGNANFAVGFNPGALPFDVVRGATDKKGALPDGTELRYQGNVFVTNPYWAAYQFFRQDITNRLLGKVSLKYDILDWLYVTGRVGTDFDFRNDENYTGYGTAFKPRGDYNVNDRFSREDNMDIMLGMNKQFGEFAIDAMIGGNRMRQQVKSLSGGGNDLVVPFLHSVRNVAAASVGYGFSQWGINSVFGSANLSYKNYLFLNLTGRQDAFSTLSRDENKIFYPSAGLSFVVSDAFQLPEVVTFAKVRSSWGQVGGGIISPYALNLTYSLVGQGHTNGSSLGQINNGQIPNKTLKPYKSDEFEIGADLRFFNNRLGLDVAYYNRKTTDEIAGLAISPTSGFGSTLLNVLDSKNSGFEIMVTGTIIDRNDFKWEATLNYAHNYSEVLDLGKNAKGENVQFMNLNESRLRQELTRHYVGQPAGMIAGYKQKVVNGKPVYDVNGYPVRSDAYEMIAPGRHPVSAGLNNALTYKNFRFSTLLDMRYGGYLSSGTNYFAYTNGLHQETVAARTGGISVSGVDANGAEISKTIPADASSAATYLIDNYFARYAQITDNIVYDASFIKLRELSLGYTLPKSMLSKTPLESATFSIVGRNLALLWSKVPNIDPESGYSTGDNDQGLEFFAMPVTRSIGFNISIGF